MALQKDDLPKELRKDYTDTIISASKKLSTLVINILKLNKLENQEIILMLRRIAKQAGIYS
ncbi:hypothetical protein [Paenibacillus sp.]|uniref:hypothetical protein n=1 Tax=Paenibacillus sp. TaxID=58172 RepID=UPI0028AFF69C|nr:hypothetical protein [Paenibacillus sp.]